MYKMVYGIKVTLYFILKVAIRMMTVHVALNNEIHVTLLNILVVSRKPTGMSTYNISHRMRMD